MRITDPQVTLLAITPRAEKLLEEAGRTCYLSFDKMDDTSESNFIRRCIKNGHHSILEHASASFRIRGASRAFTHQLVRHRLASFSQQSQRYVSEEEFNYVVPPDIQTNPEASALFDEFLENARLAYRRLREMGIKKEDARFVLPNALESEIVFSANFRELRHIFALRCARGAQWEIRSVCLAMLRLMREEAPSVFGDFVIDEAAKTAKSVL
ncbi:MAG TPA: FAD-dependent thymidylate synthase [Spirochaetota bacterium]|jgi:thymidylate synthase (FAD)|nr:FAD-dependent thymidylate synthase [Spirochaetota bacterium]OPZ36626.1 MAG: Thymidylate synthase ThyX [Spirochaetes bacterium ADurb.BinA120]HNU92536.1 FAD-dependent thymidylate synthase [Spirochaetota bacterium]HPI14910.1 FAD-dependent thymidylate synthase [Spirochaetota bacterium]HPV98767.1 FAD-dependent thymidylate synthase [Spirochaetota bacterium]